MEDVHVNPESGELEFLVKWKRYPMVDNQWIPYNDLHCDRLVQKFFKGQLEADGRGLVWWTLRSIKSRLERKTLAVNSALNQLRKFMDSSDPYNFEKEGVDYRVLSEGLRKPLSRASILKLLQEATTDNTSGGAVINMIAPIEFDPNPDDIVLYNSDSDEEIDETTLP